MRQTFPPFDFLNGRDSMGTPPQMEVLLKEADITVNGSRPWDPQIHSDEFWTRLYAQGTLGLREAYMDGLWDVADMAEFFHKVLTSKVPEGVRVTTNLVWQIVQARLLNMQN